MYASSRNYKEIVKILLSSGVDINFQGDMVSKILSFLSFL